MNEIPKWWGYFASLESSVVVGLVTVVVLACFGKLREPTHAGTAGLLSITLYSLAVVLIGQFGFKIEVASSIRYGFTSERFSWLMLSFMFDGMGRFYLTFINPAPR